MDIRGFCKPFSDMADNFIVAGCNTAEIVYNELNKPPAVLAGALLNNISVGLEVLSEKAQDVWLSVLEEGLNNPIAYVVRVLSSIPLMGGIFFVTCIATTNNPVIEAAFFISSIALTVFSLGLFASSEILLESGF